MTKTKHPAKRQHWTKKRAERNQGNSADIAPAGFTELAERAEHVLGRANAAAADLTIASLELDTLARELRLHAGQDPITILPGNPNAQQEGNNLRVADELRQHQPGLFNNQLASLAEMPSPEQSESTPGKANAQSERRGSPTPTSIDELFTGQTREPAATPAQPQESQEAHSIEDKKTDAQPQNATQRPTQPARANGKQAAQRAGAGTLRHLHALGVAIFGKDGWNEQRHALVAGATAGRATSSNALTEQEANTLITKLQAEIEARKEAIK